MVGWFSSFWRHFDLVKWVKFVVSGHFRRTHRGNGLKFCMLMYPNNLQNWFDFGHGMLIFFLFGCIFTPPARTPQPSGLEGYCRHGPGGWAGGCQTCGTHTSVTAWRIFSIRSSVELSRPLVVHYHGHLPICPIWACPWAKNLSNLPQIGSRLCGSHISETAGWMYPI